MRRIVTISYTGLHAPGGVPRWNRDLHSAFPDRQCTHYCWDDVYPYAGVVGNAPEWERARALNMWLRQTRRLTGDEIVLVDGFWGLSLEWHPRVISVSHGNWSHTTADDVAKSIPPEFPFHHNVQLKYRRDHLARGGRIIAVSKFIADQCRLQWGFEFPYINNGIDTEKFKSRGPRRDFKFTPPVIVHGTTTANKGFDHIEALKKLDVEVFLLDDAQSFFGCSDKYEALAMADLVVHPSAHEGNSYFVLETLACGVPIVSYNVGLMWELWERGFEGRFGCILDRRQRSPESTLTAVKQVLVNGPGLTHLRQNARQMAYAYSIDKFRQRWREYIEEYEQASG